MTWHEGVHLHHTPFPRLLCEEPVPSWPARDLGGLPRSTNEQFLVLTYHVHLIMSSSALVEYGYLCGRFLPHVQHWMWNHS